MNFFSKRVVGQISPVALCMAFALSGNGALANDFSVSVYSGWASVSQSVVSGEDPLGAGSFDFSAGWDGASIVPPQHVGLRGTWWKSETFGLTADFDHSKLLATDETLSASGFEALSFSDGLNSITFGAMWRWPDAWHSVTPYVGVSAGVVVPHLEIQSDSSATETSGSQLAGPSVALVAGASVELNETWDVFGEYKGSYSQLDVDLEGGGNLTTDILTNALNIGLAFNF